MGRRRAGSGEIGSDDALALVRQGEPRSKPGPGAGKFKIRDLKSEAIPKQSKCPNGEDGEHIVHGTLEIVLALGHRVANEDIPQKPRVRFDLLCVTPRLCVEIAF
jgi:hypothetical protein